MELVMTGELLPAGVKAVELVATGELSLPGGLLLAEEPSLFAGGLSLHEESSMAGEIMSLATWSVIGNL